MLNKDFLKKISVSCMSAILAISCATGMIPVSYAETMDGSIVVTYHKGSGTFASGKDDNEVTIKDGKVVDGTYEVPTRKYWTFKYWQNNSKRYNVSSDGVPEGVTEDITLAPSWESNMYYFVYDANGGVFSNGTASISQTYKAQTLSELSDKYEAPTREDYKFAGWYTDRECTDGNELTVDSSNMPDLSSLDKNAKTILYAKWVDEDGNKAEPANEDLYATLYFNANGGEGSCSKKVYKDSVFILNVTSPSCTNKTFDGWAKSATGEAEYHSGDRLSISKDTTLYAAWKDPAATEISVHFNNNGGTGEMEPQVFQAGETKALTQNSFKKDGCRFLGWATEATGEVLYKDSVEYTPDENSSKTVYLYAIWETETENTTFTVKFDANGGEGTMEDQTYQYGKSCALDKNIFVKPGYEFKGWSLTKDGAVVYSDGMEVTIDRDATLYAVWAKKGDSVENTYTVSFNSNGGDGSMDDMLFKKNVTQNLTKNKFTRKGYTFKGWSTKAGGEAAFEDGEAVNVSKNTTLYAVWSKDAVVEYTVKFDNTGVKGTMKDQIFTAGTEQKLTKCAYTKEGYTFVGWSENKDGSVKYKDEDKVTIKTNTTLYPIFTETKYTIKFDANSGSGTMKDQIFSYGKEQTLYPNGFTRDGYEFAGWSKKKGASSADYKDKASVKMTSDQTLYAVWTPATLTIVFKANGGTGTMDNQTFKCGEKVTINKNKFARDGYTFAGWGYREDSSEIAVADGETKFDWTSGAILWAVWKKDHADITVYANDGSDKTATISKSSLSSGKLPKASDVLTAKDGYTFKEWNTKADGTGTAYKDEASISADDQPTTLYATWTIASGGDTTTTSNDGKTGTVVGGGVATGDTAKTGILLAGAAAAIGALTAIAVFRKKKMD